MHLNILTLGNVNDEKIPIQLSIPICETVFHESPRSQSVTSINIADRVRFHNSLLKEFASLQVGNFHSLLHGGSCNVNSSEIRMMLPPTHKRVCYNNRQ